jgi:hypothetical protein
MPHHSYTNIKKLIVFDVYQFSMKDMYWILPMPNNPHGSVISGDISSLRVSFLNSRPSQN